MKTKIFLLISCATLFSCATPSEKFSIKAAEMGFQEVIVDAVKFRHRIYVNNQVQPHSDQHELHVYLDGDGSPWEKHRWINDDPTSRNHLVLSMMNQDDSPAILLGRPCYQGFSQSVGCHYKYWTSHRYSQEVVTSMTQALKAWLQSHEYKRIVLIGYSGGGTLAMLMASEINSVVAIITVAANLDVSAWSKLHGYNPLSGSLNPAEYSLRGNIRQFHFSGGRDNVVPERIVKKIARKNAQATFILFEHFNHHCCWGDEWPRILSTIPLDN